jgi:hypothetical protein
MRLVNLTPHVINIHTGKGVVIIDPSGEVARVATFSTAAPFIGDVPTCRTATGEVTGLPDPQDGVFLVVSGMVASAAPRPDVLSPGDLVRDESGRPVGCKGLRRSC